MATLIIADGSAEFQQRVAEAQDKMKSLGIVPIHRRPALGETTVTLHVHSDVPAETVRLALESAGLECVCAGGKYIIRRKRS